MAILLYNNGITEDYKPINNVFTEDEIIKLFNEFNEIKTCRLITVINTWCIYGNRYNPDDYNHIASIIAKEPIYTHAMFVHDSEINPEWNVTDNVLYKGYNEFNLTIKKLIEDVALNIIKEMENPDLFNNEIENINDILPQLEPIGSTYDKRVLFSFNPDNQMSNFYKNDEFYQFSKKVYRYITENKQIKEPFTIHSDNKAIIIIETSKVKTFLNAMLLKFQSREDYEICTQLTKIMKNWEKFDKPKRKTRKQNDLPK